MIEQLVTCDICENQIGTQPLRDYDDLSPDEIERGELMIDLLFNKSIRICVNGGDICIPCMAEINKGLANFSDSFWLKVNEREAKK